MLRSVGIGLEEGCGEVRWARSGWEKSPRKLGGCGYVEGERMAMMLTFEDNTYRDPYSALLSAISKDK